MNPWTVQEYTSLADAYYLENSETKAQFLASLCYQPTVELAMSSGKKIPVENGLYKTGHHTTLESSEKTFIFDQIPVSLVTFGIHMTHSFYNSTQRSGRFCSRMFETDGYQQYVTDFLSAYTELNAEDSTRISDWVTDGVMIYRENLDALTESAKQNILAERPKASEKYIEQNAPKFAQEQLRNVISMIFPTAMSHTLNAIALRSALAASWNAPLRALYTDTLNCFLQNEKDAAEYLKKPLPAEESLSFELETAFGTEPFARVSTFPSARVLSSTFPSGMLEEMLAHPELFDASHPVDLLQYAPAFKKYSVYHVTTEVTMSAATYGQKQRHRTVERTTPTITDTFYAPPLLAENPELVEKCRQHYQRWLDFVTEFGLETMIHFIPYGAQLQYIESANGPALCHEQQKRLCFCAQEEIYELSTQMNSQLFKYSENSFRAPCQSGKKTCTEGRRYCGRDIQIPSTARRCI